MQIMMVKYYMHSFSLLNRTERVKALVKSNFYKTSYQQQTIFSGNYLSKTNFSKDYCTYRQITRSIKKKHSYG